MSLKVLLADESTTIKKVFQLALQDHAVEVVAVQSGDGVLPVAQKVNPDIIFVDVLMQKKSGYDVACELKKHSDFARIPVVLMWSGFLSLDKDKFQASLADAQIEKPFDVHALRALIKKLVPKTNNQILSSFLQMPDDIVPATSPTNKPNLKIAPEIHQKHFPENTDQFEEVSLDIKLKTDSINEIRELDKILIDDEEDETEPGWVRKSLAESSIVSLSPDLDIPDEEIPLDEIKTKINTVVTQRINESKSDQPTNSPEIRLNSKTLEGSSIELENISTSISEIPAPSLQLSTEEINKIIRTEAKNIIEEAVWKIVPELATQLIQKEIKRLMEQNNNDIGTY